MKVDFTPGFILHRRAFKESSQIIDVLSRDHGRISLVAKGSKYNKKGQAGLLQAYQPLLLSWIGKTELCTLTAVESAGPAFLLQSQSALCGLYINELMVKLLPQSEADPALFDIYQQALFGLQEANNNEVTLRLFEKRLITELGYGLALDYEYDTGEAVQVERDYYYLADTGLYRWDQDQPYPKISGRSIQILSKEQAFDGQSLIEIKQLMRRVIHFYLAGNPLQSRSLFQSYQPRQPEGKS